MTPRLTWLARGVVIALAATLAAACGTPRPGLSNNSVSACYRAIPTAKAAVHEPHATFIGVHRVSADSVKGRLPPMARTVLEGDNDATVCAVAFKGTFAPGQVTGAPPNQQGKYAIVLVTSRHLHLLVSVVLEHLPRSLGKRII
jgi:hypothetical protein